MNICPFLKPNLIESEEIYACHAAGVVAAANPNWLDELGEVTLGRYVSAVEGRDYAQRDKHPHTPPRPIIPSSSYRLWTRGYHGKIVLSIGGQNRM